jgi:hypothetical protein
VSITAGETQRQYLDRDNRGSRGDTEVDRSGRTRDFSLFDGVLGVAYKEIREAYAVTITFKIALAQQSVSATRTEEGV